MSVNHLGGTEYSLSAENVTDACADTNDPLLTDWSVLPVAVH